MITHFMTRKLEASSQLDAWNDVIAETYAGLSASPLRQGFAARIVRWQMGPVVLTRPVSTPVSVERCHVSARRPVGRTLKLHVMHAGSGRVRHRRREADLRQGDMVLCAGEENYRFDMPVDHELLIAEIDLASLSALPEWIDDSIGRVIPREASGTRLVHDFLLSLWRESDCLHDGGARDYGRLLIDLITAGIRPDRPAEPDAPIPLVRRAQAIAAARVGESGLTPARLAGELGVSLRTLQAALAATGTTPGEFIHERRLQLARQRLVAQRHEAITRIAFDCGFTDSGYFSRRFRLRFGMSPAQYRALNCR
jgi:AraC family transcriptional regulator, positive regulator of tynA and feaB